MSVRFFLPIFVVNVWLLWKRLPSSTAIPVIDGPLELVWNVYRGRWRTRPQHIVRVVVVVIVCIVQSKVTCIVTASVHPRHKNAFNSLKLVDKKTPPRAKGFVRHDVERYVHIEQSRGR